MIREIILVAAAILLLGKSAKAQETFDCAKVCEQNGRKALEACRVNHPNDPSYCPTDDGHITDHCREICADLSGKSPEELQKMLPSDYKDMLEGK